MAREPTSPDEELLEAETLAIVSLLDDDARVERVDEELRRGFGTLARVGKAVSVFGSARTPESDPMYGAARDLARRLGEEGFAMITGGGPGIMEAANRGARDAGVPSIGLGIELPEEPGLNEWVDVPLEFHYFFTRKVMFVRYASAFVVFPGGFGTLDELFEAATLRQTEKIRWFPVILFGTDYWARAGRVAARPRAGAGQGVSRRRGPDRGHGRPRPRPRAGARRGASPPAGGLAAVRDALPGRLGGELDQLVAPVRLRVAEGVCVLLEHDLQLALHHPLVQPCAAEHEPAQPVHQRPVRGAMEVSPAVHHVLAEL